MLKIIRSGKHRYADYGWLGAVRRFSVPFAAAACFTLLIAACNGNGPSASRPQPADAAGLTPVYAIQGSGRISPLEGSSVTVVAIVTGDFQDSDDDKKLGGFFVQNEISDANLATSDGVFVFDGNISAVDVNVGDRVRVDGTVVEHFGETQIAATRIEVTGSGSIQPVDIDLPVTSLENSDGVPIIDLEAYEGMLVHFPQTLTVNDLFNLGRYGEVLLSAGGRSFTYTNQNPPDVEGKAAHMRAAAAQSIMLDDGKRALDVAPIRYLNSGAQSGYTIRAGDTISGVSGNLRFARGSGNAGLETWRLVPTIEPRFVSSNPRPGSPAVGGSLSVAAVNLLNYFPIVDTGPDICGPAGNLDCRGANSVEELARQFSKIIVALTQINADVVGLIEVENDGGESLQRIVVGLNKKMGGGTYAYVNTGPIGTDAITTGFIYKPGTVSLQGPHALLNSRVDPRFLDTRNRWPLAQTFRQNSNGGLFTAVINHFKSKGSSCAGDPDRNDGQSSCNQTRTDAAVALADWLKNDPTASGDPDFLILGDLNAYVKEDPLTALENAGFINLMGSTAGPEAYSYAYRGQFGAMDHALASPGLAAQVVAAIEWHINADEPPVLDYNLEFDRDPALFDPTSPYRVSDHDPIIVGIDLKP